MVVMKYLVCKGFPIRCRWDAEKAKKVSENSTICNYSFLTACYRKVTVLSQRDGVYSRCRKMSDLIRHIIDIQCEFNKTKPKDLLEIGG